MTAARGMEQMLTATHHQSLPPTGRLARLVVTLAAMLLCCSTGDAFTALYVFGDSLSDVGNVHNASLGFIPNSSYFDGRFSNGPVYSEMLAGELGLGPLLPSSEGGTNYAHGGAKTSGTSFALSFVIDDLADQVDDFLEDGPADPDALYVVWAGANDLFDGETNPQTPVDNILADLERLHTAGAREFLVPNLPLLGLTPRYGDDPDEAAAVSSLAAQHNAALEDGLAAFEVENAAARVRRLDVGGLISQLVDNPAAAGLTNVTDSAAPGLEGDDLFYFGTVVDNPDEYLFWDDVHPTRAAHALLAQAALGAVTAPGDYDRSGGVDATDYRLWRDAYGQLDPSIDSDGDLLVGAAEYTVWRDSLSPRVNPASPAPAPGSVVLMAVAASGLFPRRTPRRKLLKQQHA